MCWKKSALSQRPSEFMEQFNKKFNVGIEQNTLWREGEGK